MNSVHITVVDPEADALAMKHRELIIQTSTLSHTQLQSLLKFVEDFSLHLVVKSGHGGLTVNIITPPF